MANDLISKIAEKAKAGNMNQNTQNSDSIVYIPVNSINAHPKNREYFRDLDKTMKDKLMEDMRDNGQINPIIVKKNSDNTYTVLAGHQRLIAARRLNWPQIKAIIIEISEIEAEKLLIRDNLFRRHMGGMELAHALDAFSKLSDTNGKKSIRQIAEEIGENRNKVHFYMKLNNLIPEFQQLIEDKKLSVTTAQAFTSLSEDDQKKLFEAMGDNINFLKKKELEEQIKLRFQDELDKTNNDKKEIENERNALLSEMKNKEKDINFYKDQTENYKQQVDIFKEKVVTADIEEEAKIALSKISVLDSIIDSINLTSINLYDNTTLSLFSEKLNSVSHSISILLNYISNAANKENDVTFETQNP